MNFNKYFTHLLLLVCLVIPLVFTGCSSEAEEPLLTTEQRQLNLKSFEYVWKTIREKHYDPKFGDLDWKAVHDELLPKMEKAGKMSEARAIIRDLISRLKLSHFNVISAEVYRKLSGPAKKGSWGGVTGIGHRVIDGHALVTSIREGSPAQTAGVKPGWEILQIGKEDIPSLLPSIAKEYEDNSWKELFLARAVTARLTGKIGDSVTVRFRDGSDQTVEKSIPLVKPKGNKFKLGHLPPFYIWIDVKTMEGNIGYIAFNGFLDPPRVMPPYNSAMQSFMKADGIIIDLRGNPGGLIGMAMGMAGWLVGDKNQYLGTMIMRDSELKAVVWPRPEVYTGPVAILVDGLSASCSEIFAGGLKDLDRARIFGSTTAGAVLPSIIEKLPNNDGFQYVLANYRSAKGDILEGVGVVPDEEVHLTREALLQGKDPVLEAAVRWIRKLKNENDNEN